MGGMGEDSTAHDATSSILMASGSCEGRQGGRQITCSCGLNSSATIALPAPGVLRNKTHRPGRAVALPLRL